MSRHHSAAPVFARPKQAAVAAWLLACCAMVFVMVVLGGVTRLTESGLSIVTWRPVTGWVPPLSDAEWQAAFRLYQDSPEFRRVNFWMTVADFKSIYWLEYLHRLWGRLIGVAFLLPFLYFLVRRRLDRWMAPRLAVLFVLGAAQGLLGWYMVQSGLVERPDVSQYRLAAHLGLAVVIYGAMLWTALGVLHRRQGGGPRPALRQAQIVIAWVFVTVISGAFVAGLDAGRAFNSFPLMEGRIVPTGYGALDPWPLNLFENAAAVQFNHRLLAILLVLFILAFWARCLRLEIDGRARFAVSVLAAMAVVQAALGVATLLSTVAIVAAVAHQAGALVLFSLAVWAAHALYQPQTAHHPAITAA